VNDPKEVVSVGQEVQVKVLHVDEEKRRISLSLRRATEPEHGTPRKREPRREKPARGREKPAPTQSPGSVSLTYTMAEQLGSLKQKLGGRR
jgi:predicted RNA-binding protein with RPS1 domain